MKKQLCYKDEVKPSLFMLIPAVFCVAISIFFILFLSQFNKIEMDAATADIVTLDNSQKTWAYIAIIVFLLSALIDIIIFYKKFKKYNIIIKERNAIKMYGIAHKGNVVDMEMQEQDDFKRIGNKTVPVKKHEYYAQIEFTDDNDEKISFKTPKLNANPKFLDTKEMTVYSFEGNYYATDFGYIIKKKNHIKDLFWWMEDSK